MQRQIAMCWLIFLNHGPGYLGGLFGLRRLFGLRGGLLGSGMGGAFMRSGGASSRVMVALRIAFRSRLMTAGWVLGGPPW